jgi:hypothetical protein
VVSASTRFQWSQATSGLSSPAIRPGCRANCAQSVVLQPPSICVAEVAQPNKKLSGKALTAERLPVRVSLVDAGFVRSRPYTILAVFRLSIDKNPSCSRSVDDPSIALLVWRDGALRPLTPASARPSRTRDPRTRTDGHLRCAGLRNLRDTTPIAS